MGDIGRARVAADQLQLVADRFHSKALAAGATLAQGRVRLAEGNATTAQGLLSEAVRLWNEIGAPYEGAVARMSLAEALTAGGSERQAALEAAGGAGRPRTNRSRANVRAGDCTRQRPST